MNPETQHNTMRFPEFIILMALMMSLGALAMDPLAKMAGTGASVIGAISTFISVPFGILIGQSYHQSVLPLVCGFTVFSCLSLILMRKVSRTLYAVQDDRISSSPALG